MFSCHTHGLYIFSKAELFRGLIYTQTLAERERTTCCALTDGESRDHPIARRRTPRRPKGPPHLSAPARASGPASRQSASWPWTSFSSGVAQLHGPGLGRGASSHQRNALELHPVGVRGSLLPPSDRRTTARASVRPPMAFWAFLAGDVTVRALRSRTTVGACCIPVGTQLRARLWPFPAHLLQVLRRVSRPPHQTGGSRGVGAVPGTGGHALAGSVLHGRRSRAGGWRRKPGRGQGNRVMAGRVAGTEVASAPVRTGNVAFVPPQRCQVPQGRPGPPQTPPPPPHLPTPALSHPQGHTLQPAATETHAHSQVTVSTVVSPWPHGWDTPLCPSRKEGPPVPWGLRPPTPSHQAWGFCSLSGAPAASAALSSPAPSASTPGTLCLLPPQRCSWLGQPSWKASATAEPGPAGTRAPGPPCPSWARRALRAPTPHRTRAPRPSLPRCPAALRTCSHPPSSTKR